LHCVMGQKQGEMRHSQKCFRSGRVAQLGEHLLASPHTDQEGHPLIHGESDPFPVTTSLARRFQIEAKNSLTQPDMWMRRVSLT